uniref:Site-specific integrase n=1 Tax=Archaeoglobus fulgidus TaxID=2234 RepID=A0A7J2TGG9_ARCFL
MLDLRDKAIVLLLPKTGIRRGELLRIDVDDINWNDCLIREGSKTVHNIASEEWNVAGIHQGAQR